MRVGYEEVRKERTSSDRRIGVEDLFGKGHHCIRLGRRACFSLFIDSRVAQAAANERKFFDHCATGQAQCDNDPDAT